jgi:hypothetical protein
MNYFRGDLQNFIEKKIAKSNMPIKYDSFVLCFLRVAKHMIKKVTLKGEGKHSEINVTMPYYKKDVFDLKGDVYSLNEFKINLYAYIMLHLFYIYVYLVIGAKTNRAFISSVIAIAYGNYISLKQLDPKEIHFHGYAYVIDFAALIHIVTNSDSITAHHHEYVSFLDDDIVIVSNHLYFTNEVSYSYALENKRLYFADKYHYEISISDITGQSRQKSDNKLKIGIYSAGHYSRITHNYYSNHVILQGEIEERKMLEGMHEYAFNHPEIDFIIFPHYRRGVESENSAVKYYQEFLALDNMSLHKPIGNGGSPIEEIDLGVTVVSSIFWDRLFNGQKTVIVNPTPIIAKFVNNSAIKALSIQSDLKLFDEYISNKLYCTFDDYKNLITDNILGC